MPYIDGLNFEVDDELHAKLPTAPSNQIVKDSNNSTTTPLSASATFTGTATDVLGYSQIHLNMKQRPNVTPDGDANTAAGSLYIEFSPDATNWDTSIAIHVRTGIFIPQTLVVIDRYFRVRYINDGGTAAIASLSTGETADTARAQTEFRLNCYLIPTGTKELGRTIDQSVSGSDSVQLTRSVIMAKNSGDNYLNINSSAAGELLTTSSESDSNVMSNYSELGINSTRYKILVDLSDTTNFPHSETGRIDISYLKVAIDPASNTVGSIKIGVITRVDGTNADISYFFTAPFGKSPARILSINNFSPSQMKLGVSGGSPVFGISDEEESDVAAVNTGTTLGSPRGASTVTPAVGDVIIKFLHTSGSAWDGLVESFYHSDASAT